MNLDYGKGLGGTNLLHRSDAVKDDTSRWAPCDSEKEDSQTLSAKRNQQVLQSDYISPTWDDYLDPPAHSPQDQPVEQRLNHVASKKDNPLNQLNVAKTQLQFPSNSLKHHNIQPKRLDHGGIQDVTDQKQQFRCDRSQQPNFEHSRSAYSHTIFGDSRKRTFEEAHSTENELQSNKRSHDQDQHQSSIQDSSQLVRDELTLDKQNLEKKTFILFNEDGTGIDLDEMFPTF